METILVIIAVAYGTGLSIMVALGFGLFSFSHQQHLEQTTAATDQAWLPKYQIHA
ncbi:MAG: hypothetical protein WA958_04115 [Tunicatimonas sp.]